MARVWSLSKLSPCHLRLGPRPVKSSGMTALKVGGGRGLACSGSSDENWASRFAWNHHLLLRKAQRTHYEFATTHKACATCENNKRSTCERRRARRVQGTLSAGPPPKRGGGKETCAGLARPARTLRADATACGWSKRRKKCSLKGRGRRHLSCPCVDLPHRTHGDGMCGPALLGCPVRGPFPRMSGTKRDRGAELSASARLTFCAGE